MIVVGAGIAGLGAAYRLREEGHEVVLLEKAAEPGGRCRSVQWQGLWAVTGAFAFLGSETNLVEQARKLGLYTPDQLSDLTAAHRWNVLVKRKEALDFGAFDMTAAARHPYIPLGEKARLLAALPRMARQMLKSDPRDITSALALDDVNACEYFRRFSPTFVDYFLEPCMGMFCGYGEDDYSLAWAAWSSVGRLSWSDSTMWSFKERGAGRITWALGQHLAADPGTDYRLGQTVERVEAGADGVAEAKALAERLGAPVVNSYLHNDSFPASHPLWCGPLGYQGSKAAMKLMSQADVVIALGSRLGPFGTLPQHGMDYWPKDAKIIQIDADHKMLGLVKKISVGICGDAKAAAVALLARLEGRTLASDASKAQRAERIAGEKAAWEKELDEWTHERDPYSLDMIEENAKEKTFSGGNYLHPRQVLRELEKAMPPRAMVSTDIGNINSVANSYLRFEEPRSFFAPMSFGNCGYALPTIIGAKAAAPDRPAIAYAGDGAWAMSMSELMTAVRHDLPVTAVVFHNRQWGAEKKNQVDFYNRRFVAGELDNPSFAEIARSMGAEGIVVDKLEDVGPALKKAVDMQMNAHKTCVVEIMCTRELGDPFRRDALSKPVRFLDKYKDYV
ncbi:MAG: sulfoacetaldehyde acetyltransferase [Rubrivivax sp.]